MSWSQVEETLAALAPNPWAQAALLVAGAWLVGKLAGLVLSRLGPHLVKRTRTELDDEILERLRGPITLSVMLVGAHLALARFPELEPQLRRLLAGTLKTAAVIVWVVFFVRALKLILHAISLHPERFRVVTVHTRPIFHNLVTLIGLGAGVYGLLVAWQVDPRPWLASAGILGLALGLAAKDTLANLFAGVSLLADTPFRVGDFIVLDTGERGEITDIGLRSSRMLTRDDIEITIPNSLLANSKTINEAGGPWRKHRVRLAVEAAYGTDVDLVEAELLAAARDCPDVAEQPEPRVRFRQFGASGLSFELLAWIEEPVLRGRVLHALHADVYRRFGAAGIEIPFPKRDVYLHQPPAAEDDEAGGRGVGRE